MTTTTEITHVCQCPICHPEREDWADAYDYDTRRDGPLPDATVMLNGAPIPSVYRAKLGPNGWVAAFQLAQAVTEKPGRPAQIFNRMARHACCRDGTADGTDACRVVLRGHVEVRV